MQLDKTLVFIGRINKGYRDIQGVVAEGKLKGNGAIWTVLGALGGIALAAAGG